MFWLQALVAVAIVCGTVVVAGGRGDGVTLAPREETQEWAEREGPIVESDLDSLQITVAARGYRMDEVDEVLDRLGAEIGERDAKIAHLEHVLDVIEREPAPTPRGLPPSAWDPQRKPLGVDEVIDAEVVDGDMVDSEVVDSEGADANVIGAEVVGDDVIEADDDAAPPQPVQEPGAGRA